MSVVEARRDPTARAGLLLVAGLLAWATPGPEAAVVACRAPAEMRAIRGHTVAVRCDGAPEARALRGPARLLFGLPIDVNAADAATLDVLPGIGPARARSIVETRALRPFADVEDLVRVSGIGPRTVEGLRGLAAADPPG